MGSKQSTASLTKIAMLTAMLATFLVAFADLRREQRSALEDLTMQQATQARLVGEAMRVRLESVRRDLETVAEVASRDDRLESVARRLFEGEGAYRELEVIDAKGAVVFRDAAGELPRLANPAELAEARNAVIDGVDTVAVSPPVLGEHEQLRFFRFRSATQNIVLLLDVDRLLGGITGTSNAQDPVRWILVDNAHRWLELASAHGRAWHDDGPALPEDLKSLLSAMTNGKSGAMLVSRDAADSLGLSHRLAVAGYTLVPTRLGGPWSMAVVSSARRMRDRGRFATWRLIVSMGLAGLLVAIFGIVTLREQRRGQALAQALELAEATSALRERSEKMVEAIPLGILALDDEMHVTSVNPYLAERGVAVASSLTAAFPHASSEEIAAIAALADEARVRKVTVEGRGLALHLQEAERRELDVHAIPLERPLADVSCFVALHDRTRVRALERTLVRAEKLATIGTLAAGVAHEVGTPLGIISGRAEQLLARTPPSEDRDADRKNLVSIMTQVDKVSTTIRQLLDFARMRPIDAAAVTPTQLLQNAAALLDHRFSHAKVALHDETPLSVPAVSGDPGQLEQVLVNLLINACDACAPGGNVWTRATAAADQITIEVRDDGVGIGPENLSLVFNPFFTTKKRGQGTGLGLSIAADIVKNHGGTLEVESVVGHGTTFRVHLPQHTSHRA